MNLTRQSVELLAPAGNWDSLTAAVESGADAVYLGGKHFNMRMHEGDFNFDDELLKKAVAYAHAHDVKLYVTVNNLISDEELGELTTYLTYLNEIRPDAILVQDMAVVKLARDLGLTVPLHASVMMNTHNEQAALWLKDCGITRVVVSREMGLAEISLLKEHTGLEIEYFVHGDMCIAESGQCIHSGVLFGQSSNRGRCLKPCRWPYRLIDEQSGKCADGNETANYKLALKDMCMYKNLRELIQAGVYSFKIEGRMRPASFVRRLVGIYRRAIDAYLADPCGAAEGFADDWDELYKNRVRDFTTAFALGQPTVRDIGLDGKREPRFFSAAVPEAGFADEILRGETAFNPPQRTTGRLSVRVGELASAKAALDNGADAVYVGGEAFLPLQPWTKTDYETCLRLARDKRAKMIVATPRTTTRYVMGEMHSFLTWLNELQPDGLLVGNMGMFRLARKLTALPVQTDVSFNLFNHVATEYWQQSGAIMSAASPELSFAQLRPLIELTTLPIEVIVHGSIESMVCDHNIAAMSLPDYEPWDTPELAATHYALLDEAGEKHSLRLDQYGRTHIYFARDLCLYPYLAKFGGVGSYRLEAQDYTPEFTGYLTRLYRERLDNLAQGNDAYAPESITKTESLAPRPLGIGIYRYRQSRNSV